MIFLALATIVVSGLVGYYLDTAGNTEPYYFWALGGVTGVISTVLVMLA